MQPPSSPLDTSAEKPHRPLEPQPEARPQVSLSRYAGIGAWIGYAISTGIGLYLWGTSPGTCTEASWFLVIVCPLFFGMFALGFGIPGVVSGAALGLLLAGFLYPHRIIRTTEPKTTLLFSIGVGLLFVCILAAIYFGFQTIYKFLAINANLGTSRV